MHDDYSHTWNKTSIRAMASHTVQCYNTLTHNARLFMPSSDHTRYFHSGQLITCVQKVWKKAKGEKALE